MQPNRAHYVNQLGLNIHEKEKWSTEPCTLAYVDRAFLISQKKKPKKKPNNKTEKLKKSRVKLFL